MSQSYIDPEEPTAHDQAFESWRERILGQNAERLNAAGHTDEIQRRYLLTQAEHLMRRAWNICGDADLFAMVVDKVEREEGR